MDTAGDGALTLFDSPARAIACAEAVRDGVRALGLQVRSGVHTGVLPRRWVVERTLAWITRCRRTVRD